MQLKKHLPNLLLSVTLTSTPPSLITGRLDPDTLLKELSYSLSFPMNELMNSPQINPGQWKPIVSPPEPFLKQRAF